MSASRLEMRALIAGLLALAGACSFSEPEAELVENRCSADADCGGAICDRAVGMCVTPSTPTLRLAVEVTPASDPTGGTPTTRVLGPFEIEGPGQQDLTLAPSINVIGDVRWAGLDEAIQATVRFTRRPEIEAAPRVTKETTTVPVPVEAADGMPADYAVRVLADREYDIVVEPTGEHAALLPPLRLSRPVPGGGDFVRIPLTYPDTFPALRGVVVGPDEEAVSGLQVQAVEVESGRVVSSTAVTAPASSETPGEFEVHLDPGAASFVLRISGGPDEPLYPTLLADPAYFFPDETGYARILVPMLSRITYRGRVTPKDDATGVPNAVLAFRSVDVYDDTTGVTSSFRTTVTTGPSGTFEAEIYPGTYDIVVTPPPEMRDASGDEPVASTLGVLFETLRILPPAMGDELVGQTFELPQRARLGGTVQTSDGRQVPGTTVQAVALNRPGEVPAAPYNRSSDAVTDATGQFTLPLDLGSYDVTVKPPAESGFPWRIAPAMSFGSSTVIQNTFEIEAPVPLSGTVIGPGDEAPALAGAEIRAWVIFEEDGGAVRALPVARTTSREDGSYTLLLPSRF